MMKLAILLAAFLSAADARPKLIVVSVDGLDHRYLSQRDRLGLRIPNIRRILNEGQWADGVIGVLPTITWPSHTTLITGVEPARHGIQGNRRPASEGGDYYWSTSLLKVKTLWHATRAAGLKSAAITWPVTVDAAIDYNLPEYFRRRNGGAMDLDSIESKATPGLVAEIAKAHPSFPHEWMDDRSRAQAAIFFMKQKGADLILLHFVDHDAEAHERGPFTREANALIEYTDELIGGILAAAGKEYVVALVSDHGFERVDRLAKVNLPGVRVQPGLLTAADESAAQAVRKLAASTPDAGIGREVPAADIRRFFPSPVHAAFEPAPHVMFGDAASHEKGNHGFWPLRQDYRSVFALWGAGVRKGRLPEMEMTAIAGKLAAILAIPFAP